MPHSALRSFSVLLASLMRDLPIPVQSLLAPWLRVVFRYSVRRPRLEYFRVMSFLPVHRQLAVSLISDDMLTIRRVEELVKLSCAMEIVVLALRLEPRVSELLRPQIDDSLVTNTRLAEKMDAGIVIEWDHAFTDPELASLLAVAGGPHATVDAKTAAIAADYEATKRRLHELDTHGRLVDFQIPLTIRFSSIASICNFTKIHALLAAIVATSNVETSSVNQTAGAVYRLLGVAVGDCDGSVDALEGIEALGIDLLACRIHATIDRHLVEELLRLDPSQAPLALDICVVSTAAFLPLLEKVMHLGGRLGSLAIRAPICASMDWQQLAQVMSSTELNWHSLRRLDVHVGRVPLDDDALDTLETTMETLARRQHAGTWQLESLIIRSEFATAACARRLVAVLARWLPSSLKSLLLDIEHMDDECLRLVLESCPQLEMLVMKATSVEPLLDAFRRGECHIQRLNFIGSMWTPLKGEMELLETLADPKSRLAKTLIGLQLASSHLEPEYVSVLEKVLRVNSVLQCVMISHVREEDASRLDAFNGSLLPAPVASGVVSAFVSVIAAQPASSALGSLDSELVAKILAFGASINRRVVVTPTPH